MDKIIIKDLEVFANHGVFKEEKALGQKFLLTIDMKLSTREAAITNDLTKSIHYGEVAHKVEKEFQKESYDLIETAAEVLAEFLLKEYDLIEDIKVIIKKPWAPILRSIDTVAIEIERRWNRAFISMGSNVGQKEENINNALDLLAKDERVEILKKSSLIVTEPWGYLEQEDFLNGVIEIKTLLSPKELMKKLLDIEKVLKRERTIKWGPRTLDLDIIFYDNLITEDEFIVLPHPRMHLREFVLKPLNEIAPNKIHPLYKKRVFELLDDLKK